MKEAKPLTIYQLLLKRKRGFFIYIAAAFLPILQQLTEELLFSFSFTLIGAESTKELLIRLLVFFIGMASLPVFYWLSRRLRIGFMRDILLDIRILGFRRIMALPIRIFSRKSRDQHLSLLVNDINLLENDFFLSFLNVIFNGGLTLACLVILLGLDWIYGLICALATLMVALTGRIFRGRIVRLKQGESDANQDFSRQMSNVYSGLEILKLNGVEEPFRQKSMGFVTALERVKMRFNIFDQFQGSTMETMGLIFTILSFIYVGYRLAEGRLSLALAILMVQITQRALFSMIQLFPHYNKLKASQAIFERIAKGDEEESLEHEKEGGESFALNHSLEVRDLDFAYDSRSILQKLSFSVEAGEKILLKGASGSGKTTLFNLLAGVYTDYSGSITYDGQELRDIALPSLNEGIAEIYQDVFLFEDSLQNNITLFSNYPQSEIERAVRQAGLSELIERLPQGLSTPLTENGKNLSGGERQRIAIARAIIKGTRVLLADEATSSLDEALGRQIEATLLDLDATVIAISHRRYEGVTDRYDKVLEIESGSLSAWETRDYFRVVV